MIQLCDNSICTGCMACYASCNQQAIEIQENNFGFLQPSIKHDVCIECGICVKTCPVLSPSPFQKKNKKDLLVGQQMKTFVKTVHLEEYFMN